ncbi:MAG: putative signal peptide protein [Polaromonas sp.]|nr:putative signal peptide protein [Polaromonas sp.]
MQKILNLKKFVLPIPATAIFLIMAAANCFAQPVQGNEPNANALIEKHMELKQQLSHNQYQRPLFLESTETSGTVSSTVYAVLESPFPTVSATFKKPDRWCEVLILHLNTKYCQANKETMNPGKLEVKIGKKTPQSLAEAFLLDFSYRVTSSSANYLAVQLHASKGPLNTTDYEIVLQAVPLPEGKTFINLRYSYEYGLAGRLAMQAYLSTLGRGKIGFTKIVTNSKAEYVGGMRGAVERNTMRYYLAIEAYLESLKQPPDQQFNARLQYWFDATEEYPQQLHEVDRSSYLTMKKDEYQRQQSFPFKAQ